LQPSPTNNPSRQIPARVERGDRIMRVSENANLSQAVSVPLKRKDPDEEAFSQNRIRGG